MEREEGAYEKRHDQFDGTPADAFAGVGWRRFFGWQRGIAVAFRRRSDHL